MDISTLLIIAFLGCLIYIIVLIILKNRYFKSEDFLNHQQELENTILEYNEISSYFKELPNKNQFYTPENNHSHLASFKNTSNHNYIRTRNVRTTGDNVHPASLQIVRKASEEPVKYLCKYFQIKPTEENLYQLEEIGNNVDKMETTIRNLRTRQQEIERNFNPPKYVLRYFHKELMEKIGLSIPNITPQYAKYIFEYISAGGNSSQRCVIKFDIPTIESTSQYISEKIKFNSSVAGQRALMTKSLRMSIKERDNYTCQICNVSTRDQSLLLLEVDHIMPISKGGMSSVDNLQTLCWKCNRSKSNKIQI